MSRLFQFLLFFAGLVTVNAASLIEKHPQKDLILRSLQRLVDEHAKISENHFFIVRNKEGKDWVYWREGRLLWNTDLSPYVEKRGPAEIRARAVWDLRLRTPGKHIDLDSGVVSSGTDIGGSTFLVTKDFAANLVYECVLNGELVRLKKEKVAKEATK